MRNRRLLGFSAQIFGIFAGIALLGVAWAVAQQPVPPTLPAPVLRVNTGLVLVNLVATDKDGNKISDLSKEDIRLLEDGKEQDIAFLTLERVDPAQQPPRPAPLPPNVYTNRPEYRAPTGPPTIILLDIVNTQTDYQRRARIELLKFVNRQLEAGHKVAVFTLGLTVRIMQDFTDDPETLRAAIESFIPGQTVELDIEDVDTRLGAETAAADTQNPLGRNIAALRTDPSERARARAQSFLEETAILALDQRAQTTENAFRMISQWAAAYPGRKNLIWVTGGLPKAKMSKVFNQETGEWRGQMRVDKSYETDLRRAASALSDAQVTVYAIDARGLLATEGIAVGEVGTVREVAGAQVDALATAQDTRVTMDMFAKDTGGLFFTRQNDIAEAVRTSIDDGSHYYLVGYYPKKKKFDGKFRKIEIKSVRDGLELRHRRGYFAVPPSDWKKVNDNQDVGILTALLPGTPRAGTVMFDTLVEPPQAAKGKTKVPVKFIVNAQTLTYEGTENGPRTYDIEFRALAYELDGTTAGSSARQFRGTVPADKVPALLAQGLPFLDMTIELEPGTYIVSVAVRDNHSGNIGSAHLSLRF